jgi:hypothetical protein
MKRFQVVEYVKQKKGQWKNFRRQIFIILEDRTEEIHVTSRKKIHIDKSFCSGTVDIFAFFVFLGFPFCCLRTNCLE